jgi:Reverse transcriptase (RNA-dependent DNA polymerase)
MISPLLFILAVDTLQAMVHELKTELTDFATTQTTILQFADDTTIITLAHPRNIKLLMTMLEVFAAMSGLKINLSKSGFLPNALPNDRIPVISNLL